MQILHSFVGSVQQYQNELRDPERYRPRCCPQCAAPRPLLAHGFYRRTLEESGFDGRIAVRRYLCRYCRRTVSLLPEFALPYLRTSLLLIALFLSACLLRTQSLRSAAAENALPYQRGQFWLRRFRQQADALCMALAGMVRPVVASDFAERAVRMLEACGWTEAHRFLFGELRFHLLGWPRFLAPRGLRITVSAAPAAAG